MVTNVLTDKSVLMNQEEKEAAETYDHGSPEPTDVLIKLVDFSAYYGQLEVLKNINLAIENKKITVFMGPSGCGKSTLVRTLNRMNDNVHGFRTTGKILLDGQDIYAPDVDPVLLKTR